MIRHWLENHQFELRLLHWMQRDLLVADQTARRMAEVAHVDGHRLAAAEGRKNVWIAAWRKSAALKIAPEPDLK